MADCQLTTATPTSQTEEWRPVVGHEDTYSVSNRGRVRRERSGQGVRRSTPYLLSLNRGPRGRVQVVLHRNGVETPRLVHRLVAEAFIGPCPEGHEVNHLDGNPRNNSLANIEYCTGAENHAHAVTNGLKSRGERHPTARLTERDVLAIRKALDSGDKNRAQLAREYGVSHNSLTDIYRRRTWRHLE
jgi:hypothetical protein